MKTLSSLPLKMSDTGANVATLHELLKTVGFKIDASERKAKQFGKSTSAAVLDFQRFHGLKDTGVVDDSTFQRLKKVAGGLTGDTGGEVKPKAVPGIPKGTNGNSGNGLPVLDEDSRKVLQASIREQLAAYTQEALGKIKPEIEKAVNALPVDLSTIADYSIADVMKKYVFPQIRNHKNLSDDLDKLEEKVNVEPGNTVKELLHLDKPANKNPMLVKELTTKRLTGYAKMVSIPNDKIQALIKEDVAWDKLSEADLDQLVSKKILTAEQKEPMFRVMELAKLTGDNEPMVSAIENAKFKNLRDLVSYEREDWIKLIKDKKIEVPAGEDVESYAENILYNVEQTFATPFVMTRVTNVKVPNALDDQKWIQAFPAEAWTTGGGLNPELDNGSEEANKKFKDLAEFVNTYKYMGVGELIRKDGIDLAKKREAIVKQVDALKRFYQNNPSFDMRSADFLEDHQYFDWTGISEKEKPYVTRQLMAYQRVGEYGTRAETGINLLKKGLDSAVRITDLEEEEFIRISGLETDEGKVAYRKAQDQASASIHTFELLRDLVKGPFKNIAVSNASPGIVNDLKQLDGFADLFGNQDFCDCEHCKSIFSPAAYFTDLMHFTEQHVSKKVFIPNQLQHPLYLKNRRPDLWDLQLTCENTNTEIPYLQIVNEVLESYLKRQLNVPNVYDVLNTTNLSCFLPFHLPLAETRTYLSHFDLGLHEIYQVLKQPKLRIWREWLKFSEKDLEIILTADPAGVLTRFGTPPTLADFPVVDFMNFSGLSRGELDELLAVKFIDEIKNVTVDKTAVNNDIQPFVEVMKGLNNARLDLMHRMMRLWRKSGWKMKELDLVLTSMKSAGLLNLLDDRDAADNNFPKILQVAMLSPLKKLGLTPEEICGVVGHLPGTSLSKNTPSFRERLFDMSALFGVVATAPDGTKTYGNSFVIKANKAQDTKTALVLAGLSISEQDLSLLLKRLGQDLSQDINVDIGLLSKLYSHARLASAFKVTTPELMSVIDLFLNAQVITRPGEYYQVQEAIDWIKSSGLKITELDFILKGTENETIQYTYNADSVAELVLAIQKLNSADPVAELKLVLQREFNVAAEQIAHLLAMVGTLINSAPVMVGLNTAFNNAGQPVNPAELDAVVTLFHEAERTMKLITKLELDARAHGFVCDHAAVFDIGNLKALTAGDVKQLLFYSRLLKRDPEKVEGIHQALLDYQQAAGFNAGGVQVLAAVWKQPEPLVQSVMLSITNAANAISAAHDSYEALMLCVKLGVNGETFIKLAGSTYAELHAASDIALGAFASQYVEEKVRKEKLEPYYDRLNTLKRDALCHYILGRRDRFKFRDRNELYAFFLLDVEMSGCFRSSRVVQATQSVQLYIHRCLLNLEQSDPYLNDTITDIKVKPTFIPLDEWDWRKNYRVWEANRKVFVYPESYIDPALRLDKTHIFKELEEELLQEKITTESAEMAYKKYLSGFTELAHLQYAGSYLHRIPVEDEDWYDMNETNTDKKRRKEGAHKGKKRHVQKYEDVYYFFARTNIQPYQYYYRTLNMAKKLWGYWEKIELAIEAKEVSSIIFNGRLYIFWTEVQNKEISNVNAGSSESSGFVFKVYTKYSFLNEHKKWAAPQRLYVGHTHSTDDKLFARVWGDNAPTTQTARDKRKDYTIEQYQERVFHKPYVIKNDSLLNPLELNYIWTQERGVETVNYNIHSRTFDQYILSNIGYRFIMPSVTIQVVNGDFSEKKNVKVTVYFFVGDDFLYLEQVDGTIQQTNSCNAVAKFTYNDTDWGFILTFDSNTLQNHIKASSNLFSLARNVITDTSLSEMSFSNITTAKYSFLEREYIRGFDDNGEYMHYVETGNAQFTDRFRVVTQFKNGDASLQITNGSHTNYFKLSTILTEELGATLFAEGVEAFLSLKTQTMIDPDSSSKLDFRGAYGAYYWEFFFHIPFVIANHLNANNKFKEAKWWYERIFNPTADETPADIKPYDHNWRFREFRNLDLPKLKEMLSDPAAIEVYHKDPFNPHAIARLRISAYQKAIVMKYIDNLLDWGDYLFTQDTRDSINEAMQLYILASDILGRRPVKIGKCATANPEELTYEKIGPRIDADSEILVTLENWQSVNSVKEEIDVVAVKDMKSILAETRRMAKTPPEEVELEELATTTHFTSFKEKLMAKAEHQIKNPPAGNGPKRSYAYGTNMMSYGDVTAMIKGRQEAAAPKEVAANGKGISVTKKHKPTKHRPHKSQTRQSILAFCVPNNAELLKYWDRVEDRMYKIRHCMNISGVRRSLALFQPPIDPMMLVRARAAGLSLEDILAQVIMPSLPPYRFVYLIEKAKQVTQMVQSFGTALIGALEKKDAEELTILRSVHERNILKLTKEVKKNQLQEAKLQYKSAIEAKTGVQQRIDHYSSLIDSGLTGWEVTQQVSTHAASGLEIQASVQKLLGGILLLIPQLGSPFAMKYGGAELGESAKAFGEMTSNIAAIAHAIAASAGLEATFQRREEEWKFQLKTAEQDMKQSVLQELASEIRQGIAEKELGIHETNIEQADELHDFYRNKFSNLGLYQFLSGRLNRVYREAYNLAYDLARTAEKAYQHEQNDQTFFIAADNWQFDRAGLMAAESLTQQLQKMEQAFMSKNKRTPEITQSFSLALLDPFKLLQLQQTGSCSFKIPEIAFEALYPGQFNRQIKAVRLTMPCITGPYTNVSAKLTLTKSEIEKNDGDALIEQLIGKNSSVNMSSGNNDSGMFEFSFKDERYLPFEGAGAISEWQLELPSTIRSFDYRSISDVILQLSYTASDGNRQNAENVLAAAISDYATNVGLFRILSLKHEFPDAFHRLLNPDQGQPNATQFQTLPQHFPYSLQNNNLAIAEVKVFLCPKKGQSVNTMGLTFNTNRAVNWVAGDDIAYPGAANNANKIKGGTVAGIVGSPFNKNWTLETSANDLIDPATLDDMMIRIKYRIV